MARILGLGQAFPEHDYPQETLTETLVRLWDGSGVDPEAIRRIHRHTTVERRHLTLPLEQYRAGVPFGVINDLWIEGADRLGTRAVSGALKAAGVAPAEVDYIVFVTVTGLATPSIDARVSNRLGFPAQVRRVPLFGLGCVAGASGLARCVDLLAGRPRGIAVLLSVELCSLTFQPGDRSVANIIATGLFGDGAAAVVLGGRERPGRGPFVAGSRSVFYPGTEDVMGWRISEKGFELVLSPRIPELIRRNLRADVDGFLAEHGLRRGDIREWMVHTGGPKVFSAIEETLELPPEALESTREVLRTRGNLSSASVLAVLHDVIQRRRPPEGSWGMMLALGPGFCSEMVLIRW